MDSLNLEVRAHEIAIAMLPSLVAKDYDEKDGIDYHEFVCNSYLDTLSAARNILERHRDENDLRLTRTAR